MRKCRCGKPNAVAQRISSTLSDSRHFGGGALLHRSLLGSGARFPANCCRSDFFFWSIAEMPVLSNLTPPCTKVSNFFVFYRLFANIYTFVSHTVFINFFFRTRKVFRFKNFFGVEFCETYLIEVSIRKIEKISWF